MLITLVAAATPCVVPVMLTFDAFTPFATPPLPAHYGKDTPMLRYAAMLIFASAIRRLMPMLLPAANINIMLFRCCAPSAMLTLDAAPLFYAGAPCRC